MQIDEEKKERNARRYTYPEITAFHQWRQHVSSERLHAGQSYFSRFRVFLLLLLLLLGAFLFKFLGADSSKWPRTPLGAHQ
jgi:hypothetical protein